MNEGIHLDLDTWIVPGQIRKANLCRGLGNRYTPAGTEVLISAVDRDLGELKMSLSPSEARLVRPELRFQVLGPRGLKMSFSPSEARLVHPEVRVQVVGSSNGHHVRPQVLRFRGVGSSNGHQEVWGSWW